MIPDEGEILIGGRNIKEYDLKELREQVGVIFQDYVNYYMTARENIGVGRVDKIEQSGTGHECRAQERSQ